MTAATVVALVGTIILVFLDRLIPGVIGEGDWVASPFNVMDGMFSWWEFCGSRLWYLVIFVVWVCSLICPWLARRLRVSQLGVHLNAAFVVIIAMWVGIAVLPALVFYRMLEPRHPLVGLPGPNNGYETLIEVGAALQGSQIFTLTVLPNSLDEVAAELDRYRPQLEKIDEALGLPCHVVFDWESDPKTFTPRLEDFSDIRCIAKTSWVAARYYREIGDVTRAADHALLVGRVGTEISRGGLWIQSLVSFAVSGHDDLILCLPRLHDSEMRDIVTRLIAISERQEPMAIVNQRERAWQRQAYGWTAHLSQVLAEVTNEPNASLNTMMNAWRRHQCVFRLIALECAIRAHRHEYRTLPKSLDDLVPDFLPERLLNDPFAKTGQQFRYSVEGEQFQLYSVGPDQVDDGGAYVEQDNSDPYPNFYEQQGDFSITGYRSQLLPEEPWLAPDNADDEAL